MSMLIGLNQFPLVCFYNQVPVLADPLFRVIFDANILILFRVREDLFAAFLVFKSNLVKTLATFAAVRLYGGDRSIVRQGIGGLRFAVVNCTRNNWPVRISIQKFNNHILPIARQEDS